MQTRGELSSPAFWLTDIWLDSKYEILISYFFEHLLLTQISIQSPCERTIPWHCLAEVDLVVPGCCHGDLGWGEGVRNSGQYAYLHRAVLGNILADMETWGGERE